MVWSNWQTAISRGAVLVLLFWSGLAWTQSPQRPAADPAERIMVVHENGKSTRCRVLESWQLPDGRVAHLLEAIETGERITIVDDQAPNGERVNARAMAKRIFAWGQGRRTPPAGSPIPPHLRQDSGIVIKNEIPPPTDAVRIEGPAIVNRLDEKAIGGGEAPMTIVQAEPANPNLLQRLFGKPGGPADPQVVDIRNHLSAAPIIAIEQPKYVDPIDVRPQIELAPTVLPGVGPGRTLPPIYVPNQTCVPEVATSEVQAPKKTWRPGANIQAWLQGKTTPCVVKAETAKTDDARRLQAEKLLAEQNKVADKYLTEKIEKISKAPFSTAMLAQPDVMKPEPTPLGIPNKTAPKDDKALVLPPAPETPKQTDVKRDMWGVGGTPMLPPGKSLLDLTGVKPELVKLPPPPGGRSNDPLLSPERLIPSDDKMRPKGGVFTPGSRNDSRYDSLPPMPAEIPGYQGIPPGAQSVLAAKSGLLGPVTYVPVPTVTVPQPNNPPMPPPPQMPDAPNLNAYVNAFTPAPKPMPQQQPSWQQMGAFSQPMMQQQQVLAQQQQVLAQQQQMLAQQAMMQYGYRVNPYMMNPYQPQYGMTSPLPSQGPMTNFSRQYGGPQAPNPFAANPAVQTGYAPAAYPQQPPMYTQMPQQPQQPHQLPMQQVSHPQQPTQQQAVAQQVEQLIKVMRESPFPAQREWAAQSLTSYEWRAHPQIVPALAQSASHDPAASVRSGCVYCLGRMNAAVEPVFGALNSLRNDIDPRVRQEVEQAFTRLSQTPMAPQ